tara:strand:+ start:357 stop:881 length:525 start_codon:yes stop_codon:yes gene_type:complete
MIIKTNIKDLIIIKNRAFKDSRGYFKELIREREIKNKLPFTVMSYSKKNVVRGLHIQTKNSQGKFVSVIKGRIFDVAVDLRKNSSTFGKIFTKILSEKNSLSVYIPAGFAHGFCGLDTENFIIYSCTKYRDAKSETGIKYNDENLNIKWPIKNPILSINDKKNISFKEFKKKIK